MIIVRWIFQCALGIVLLALIIVTMMLHIIVMFWHRFLPSNITLSLSSFCYRCHGKLYFWLITKAMNISLSIQKSGAGVSESATRIVMANHQSLFDIVLLFGSINELVEGEKQFVLKESLKWMPIIGWYCWLRNYPFVNRLTLKQLRANPKLKEQATNDFKKAIRKNKEDVKTWIIFPEGTRNGGKKKSPYRYLLKPQVKGMQLIAAEVEQPIQLINASLCLPKPYLSFWQIITTVKSISIHMSVHDVKDVVCPTFIDDQWSMEDKRLQAHYEGS